MSALERRIRLAALLVAVGVIVVLFSLLWRHPLSFMAFLIVGCPFVLVGALLYLLSIATKGNEL